MGASQQNPLAVVLKPMGISGTGDALVFCSALDVLRSDEGNSITFVCDNPDFNGQPNAKVICNGAWTGWEDVEFSGESVFEALRRALAAQTRKMVLDQTKTFIAEAGL